MIRPDYEHNSDEEIATWKSHVPAPAQTRLTAEQWLDSQDRDEGAYIWDGNWTYYRSDFVHKLLEAFRDKSESELRDQLAFVSSKERLTFCLEALGESNRENFERARDAEAEAAGLREEIERLNKRINRQVDLHSDSLEKLTELRAKLAAHEREFCEGCDHGVVGEGVCTMCGGTGYKERRKPTNAEAEVAALRKQQESWRKGTESNMKSMAKLAENLKEELGEALREAAALREAERSEQALRKSIVDYVNGEFLKNIPETEDDGFGMVISTTCCSCGLKLEQIVRPGKSQCGLCG